MDPPSLFIHALKQGQPCGNSLAAGSVEVPIVTAIPALGPMGVTGNEKGYFLETPEHILVTMINSSTIDLTMTNLPDYEIVVGERMFLFTTLRQLLTLDDDTLYFVGAVVVVGPTISISTTGIVTTVVVSGGGVVGGAALELQGVGALALMGCSDPNTKARFRTYRILSPVALFDSYAGVVIGNGILMCVVGLIQVIVCLGLRYCRSHRAADHMAFARFPSLMVTAVVVFHTGTAFASARLISSPGDYSVWEVAIGVVGFVFSLLLPVALAVHPYLRIGRAYQEYTHPGKSKPWLTWVVPQGAIFSSETRRAYGPYISAYRAPPKQVWWTSMPTWTPLVFLVAGLIHPDTVEGCQALYVCMGIALICIAGIVVWQAPLRSYTSGWLDATSRVALACVAICMAVALVKDSRLRVAASNAAFAFAVVLMVLTCVRVVHACLCLWFDWGMEVGAIPLTTVWTHVLGNIKKQTTQFATVDEELRDLAKDRDKTADNEGSDAMDEPLLLVETNPRQVDDRSEDSTFDDDNDSSVELNTVDDEKRVTTPSSSPSSDSSDEASTPEEEETSDSAIIHSDSSTTISLHLSSSSSSASLQSSRASSRDSI